MADAYFLSKSDVEAVNRLLARFRGKPVNTPNRAGDQGVDHQEILAPEVYVARTPEGGIDAGPTALAGTFTGVECDIYQPLIASSTTVTLQEVTGLGRLVFNLGAAVTGDSWVLVQRDKFGRWWVVNQAADAVTPACTGCGWLAGLDTTCCLTLTVTAALGRCSCVGEQTLFLEYSIPDGKWFSVTEFELCDGTTGQLVFWVEEGRARLRIQSPPGDAALYEFVFECCETDAIYFTAGTTACDGLGTGSMGGECVTPSENLFRVKITVGCLTDSSCCPDEGVPRRLLLSVPSGPFAGSWQLVYNRYGAGCLGDTFWIYQDSVFEFRLSCNGGAWELLATRHDGLSGVSLPCGYYTYTSGPNDVFGVFAAISHDPDVCDPFALDRDLEWSGAETGGPVAITITA